MHCLLPLAVHCLPTLAVHCLPTLSKHCIPPVTCVQLAAYLSHKLDQQARTFCMDVDLLPLFKVRQAIPA